MSEGRELLVCPKCNGPMAVQYEVKIDPVKRTGGRDLPLGERRDILTFWCPMHGGETRFERVTPAGHPVGTISFRVPAQADPHDHRTTRPITLEREWAPVDRAIDDALGAPRWHEIATEGLPAESGRFFVYLGTPVGEFTECVDIANFERNATFERLGLKQTCSWNNESTACCAHYLSDDLGTSITHWMPCPLPAPPTKG